MPFTNLRTFFASEVLFPMSSRFDALIRTFFILVVSSLFPQTFCTVLRSAPTRILMLVFQLPIASKHI
ncbi:hypothetical protein BDQ17DRAFT_1314097, partial [Cyathus striatus]